MSVPYCIFYVWIDYLLNLSSLATDCVVLIFLGQKLKHELSLIVIFACTCCIQFKCPSMLLDHVVKYHLDYTTSHAQLTQVCPFLDHVCKTFLCFICDSYLISHVI